jgi:hypothetical protein
MDTFSRFIDTWHDFYMLTGTAAATLVGLVFVGLSLNIEMIKREESHDLLIIAAQTVDSFIFVLLIAITLLVPDQSRLGVGIPLAVIGVIGILNLTVQTSAAIRKHNHLLGLNYILWRFLFPLCAFVGLIMVAVSVLQGGMYVLYWLIAVNITLLAHASHNAWQLLISARLPKNDTAETKSK